MCVCRKNEIHGNQKPMKNLFALPTTSINMYTVAMKHYYCHIPTTNMVLSPHTPP